MIDYAFDILKNVAQGEWTKFSIVFDIQERMIYFKSLANQNIRYVDMDHFDFSCHTISKVLDTNTNDTDDVSSKFVDYTLSLNEGLILKAWTDLGHTDIYTPSLKVIS